MDQKVKVVVQTGDNEELYFREQEQKRIQTLREKAAQESNAKYREEHRGHCFRCGTRSLAEVKYGDVTLDMCINEGCGAVHLDPGELEAYQESFKKNSGVLSNVTDAVFSIFK